MRVLVLIAGAAVLALAGVVASLRAGGDRPAPIVPSGFSIETIAHVSGARELAAGPNGDLIVGTSGRDVYIVPHAEGSAEPAHVFARMEDEPAAGVALGEKRLFIGTQFGVWRTSYAPGDEKARESPVRIAVVRPSGVSRDHDTTTVAVSRGRLYAGVGSSCDACDPDLDATRATVMEMATDGTGMRAKAVRIRNPIALAVDPATGALWAGVAGQDELPHGHPYEFFDPVTLHAGTVDYGWPFCYENHRAAQPGHDCAHETVPRVVFPAYETPIGAAFYPRNQKGRFSFGAPYAGGAFVALHGSWHAPPVAPRVAFVPLAGDTPKTAVDWNDPAVQWREFLGGFQLSNGERIGRPTGVAVGPEGSLFVGDDKAGVVYRIRPRR